MSSSSDTKAQSANSTGSKQLKLTTATIEKLKPCTRQGGAREDEYTDLMVSGLKLTVNRTGKKAFLLRYTLNGNKKSTKLGSYPEIGIDEARGMALEMKRQIAKGIDPGQSRQQRQTVLTLKAFCTESYLPWSEENKRSAEDDLSKLNTHLYTQLGAKPLDTISPRDIQQYLSYLRSTVGLAPATANRHLSLLSSIFRLAEQYELVLKNPCKSVQKFKESNQRQRYLSAEELCRLLDAMEDTDPETGEKNRVAVAALKLLLFTGTRREEALQAEWAHIDFEKRLWFLPKTKNGKSRYVPLNDNALEVLKSLKQEPGCPYVFVSPKMKPQASGSGQQHQRLNTPVKTFQRLLAKAGITDFRIHDLRHTFASLAVNNGTSLYMVQQLLGHASPTTTQRYSHLTDNRLLEASNQVAGTVRNARNVA